MTFSAPPAVKPSGLYSPWASPPHSSATSKEGATTVVPLIVDVDGTLHRGDLLLEGLVQVGFGPTKHWLSVVRAALRGRRALKDRVAELAPLRADTLPWNHAVRDRINVALNENRPVLLASGAAPVWVGEIAQYLGVGTVDAPGDVNLVGSEKLRVIESQHPTFDYIGNARVDLPLWRRARRPIAANASAGCLRTLKKARPDAESIGESAGRLKTILRAMRPHQWSKNLLMFLPALAAHLAPTMGNITRHLLAFFAFSACASAIYILNDLSDLPHDRAHPRKARRPIAAGTLPIPAAVGLFAALVLVSAVLSSMVGGFFPLFLVAYAALSLSYVFALKRRLLVDVVVLALLYASRVVAGASVASVPLSRWFIAFTVFLFFSLAVAKRVAELQALASRGAGRAPGRAYAIEDITPLISLGCAAATASCLVFCLWAAAPETTVAYRRPDLLLVALPLLLYWHARIWVFVGRQALEDDPVAFAIRDRVSLAVGVIFVLFIVAAH